MRPSLLDAGFRSLGNLGRGLRCKVLEGLTIPTWPCCTDSARLPVSLVVLGMCVARLRVRSGSFAHLAQRKQEDVEHNPQRPSCFLGVEAMVLKPRPILTCVSQLLSS